VQASCLFTISSYFYKCRKRRIQSQAEPQKVYIDISTSTENAINPAYLRGVEKQNGKSVFEFRQFRRVISNFGCTIRTFSFKRSLFLKRAKRKEALYMFQVHFVGRIVRRRFHQNVEVNVLRSKKGPIENRQFRDVLLA
jgi:hypothetical protein